MHTLFRFVFYYPFFMALFWIAGAVIFFFRREWRRPGRPVLASHPAVTVLIPCHNEELSIEQVVRTAAASRYPGLEVLVIDDASTDATAEVLRRLQGELPRLRVLTLAHNLGKAQALNLGALASDSEYLMCVDADALLEEDAIAWMVHDLERNPRVGAVTGNPRVLNRTTLVSRVQVGEFSAIVGMIKRTQRLLGRVYTVSGVCSCFRRLAVHEVGYWSTDTVTEDVDISWKLQLAYWGILYEPRAVCWILVPETTRGLWRQRLRWARGGIEAAATHRRAAVQWTKRRMWPVFAELMVSTVWCYAVVVVVLAWLATQLLPAHVPPALRVVSLLPGWTGSLLALVCLLQFVTGLALDRRYEGNGLVRNLFWAIWYPALYWVITAGTSVVALPVALHNLGRSHHAVWRSPDR
ncbi:MAG TPA: poly-beta-1,6-N-acetyl-D-glucosamine synthase [Thermoanaerobaculia bacterium]|jgi:biofilm PGA synthesis N-glycosyltransferase PgaC|nr:poly-beta-1,6-N-acetyl-D-glucosamine synthase [Thermoanaerobaculia bacterium]